MMLWAWRQWLQEPLRAALAAAVFAAALALCLLFEGLRSGILTDVAAYPSSLPADFVAVERGNGYFAVMPSQLPQLGRERLEAVDGVAAVDPLTMLPAILQTPGLRTPGLRSPIQLQAYEGQGGPPRLTAGTEPLAEGSVVLDERLARRHGLEIGDDISIFDYRMRIVGLSAGSASPFTPYAFVSYDTLLSLLLESNLPIGLDDYSLLSFLLIRTKPGVDLEGARARLAAALPDADFYTPAELGAQDRAFGARLLGPVLWLLSAVAWAIAGLTMGLLRFADVQAGLRQFGIHKALGATPRQLAAALTAGSLIVAVVAMPPSLLLARGFAAVVAHWNPLYSALVWDSGVLARGLALGLASALGGGLLPLRRLVRLDPSLVFSR
ncbi:MAG: ABC transporter permease [Sinimarinibacterium sp.]|jgi:putative ABC transport system permease protein